MRHKLKTDEYNKRMRKWKKEHPVNVRNTYMKWVRANREASRLHKTACKFRKKADGYISKLILESIISDNKSKYGKLTCELCKKRIFKTNKYSKKMSFDHKYPVKLGGTNHRRNIQIMHHVCNNKKRDRLMEVFQ